MVCKINYSLLQFFRWHLPVSDNSAGIGNKALYHRFKFMQPFNPWIDNEYLTVA